MNPNNNEQATSKPPNQNENNPLIKLLEAYSEQALPDPPTLPQQLDITGAGIVQIEIDHHRRVLYVHVDGYTALRICRIKNILPTQETS